jgi:hypothetical protein
MVAAIRHASRAGILGPAIIAIAVVLLIVEVFRAAFHP